LPFTIILSIIMAIIVSAITSIILSRRYKNRVITLGKTDESDEGETNHKNINIKTSKKKEVLKVRKKIELDSEIEENEDIDSIVDKILKDSK